MTDFTKHGVLPPGITLPGIDLVLDPNFLNWINGGYVAYQQSVLPKTHDELLKVYADLEKEAADNPADTNLTVNGIIRTQKMYVVHNLILYKKLFPTVDDLNVFAR